MILHQNKKILIDLDPRTSPLFWINSVFANADSKSTALISKHLVAALLQKRHPRHVIRVSSTQKSGRVESYVITIGSVICRISTKPNAVTIQECKASLSAERKTFLLVPNAKIKRVFALATESRFVNRISIFSIEEFISLDIILMSCAKKVKPIETFKELLHDYNQRIKTTEIDPRLAIELLWTVA